MPSNLLAIDTNFPTFTGEEPAEEQIRALVNYLYQLRESLQYSLQNLSRENFNATELDKLTEESSKKIVEQLNKVLNIMGNMDAELKGLMGRLSEAERNQQSLEKWSLEQERLTEDHSERIQSVEETLSDLENTSDEMQGRIAEAEGDIAILQGISIHSIEIIEV